MMAFRFDPKPIEDFLLSMDHVLDASVWIDKGHIHAHLTPEPGALLDTQSILTRCVASIGADRTPEDILVLRTPSSR